MVFPPGFQQQMLVVLVHFFMHFSFVRIIVDVRFRIMKWQFITCGYSGVCACFLESACYPLRKFMCARSTTCAPWLRFRCFSVWSTAAWTPRFCKSGFVSLSTDGVGCFCCRAIVKAISAAVAADNQTPFVNKDLWGLVKKSTYQTSGKVTSLMTSQWRPQ